MTVTLNYAKVEQPIGMISKPWENRCFHDHNRWECGQKCQIAISSSFLFTVSTGPHRASSSPLPSPPTQSYNSKWPPHTSPCNATWPHPHHSNFHPTHEALSSSVTHISTYKPAVPQPRKPYPDIHYSENFKSHILNLFSLWDKKSNFLPSHCRSYDPTNWTESQYKTTLNT